MAHYIKAIIGRDEYIHQLAGDWVHAIAIKLNQNFSLIKVSDALFDDVDEQINNDATDPYQHFMYLSSSLHEVLLEKSLLEKLAYIETEYFGGIGTQSAILYEAGKVALGPFTTNDIWDKETQGFMQKPEGDRAINKVLCKLGVHCKYGLDEFDTIKLGQYR